MTKRILVIPDVHGRIFWKEPVKKYMDAVDRVVFWATISTRTRAKMVWPKTSMRT